MCTIKIICFITTALHRCQPSWRWLKMIFCMLLSLGIFLIKSSLTLLLPRIDFVDGLEVFFDSCASFLVLSRGYFIAARSVVCFYKLKCYLIAKSHVWCSFVVVQPNHNLSPFKKSINK